MPIAYTQNLSRGRFETWTTNPEMDIVQVKQIHGIDIVSRETLPCEADGLIVSWEDLDRPLAIKTADCMPIFVEGEKGVVVLHAGWKGLAHGILKRPELSLILPMRAVIGPCIHKCCFEVSPDFQENFPHSQFKHTGDKLYFDLPLEAKKQLNESFPDLEIEVAPMCTCCNLSFHSYRRNKTTERNWNLYIKG
ncbi:MAG TPA: polyphenol oxidase family protein [Bacteriovoracaceae bacterium]|nr:polyphenol oxidase family protein [Bacteriovoracaceae bacterium]